MRGFNFQSFVVIVVFELKEICFDFVYSETTYTPEELLAMILEHAKDIGENFAGKKHLINVEPCSCC